MSKIYDPLEWDDIRSLCDICECEDCPRMGDDCDGKDEDEDDELVE